MSYAAQPSRRPAPRPRLRPRRLALLLLALAFALAAGWVAGTFLPLPLSPPRPLGAPARNSPSLPPSAALPASPADPHGFLSLVPDVRQSTGYTCGASALQAVLAYWGFSEREDRLAARLHSTPEAGTHPLDILRVARDFGLTAELREGLEIADLEAALASGASVIVDLQAWRDPAPARRPWPETWEDGHYMVLLAADAENLYFEDPSLLGTRGFIPRAEFLERWHDYEGDPPFDPSDRAYARAAMFFRGVRPPSPPVPAPPPFERVR